VIAGTARGRRLKTYSRDRSIRPTADRVREAIFDLIGPGPPGPKVLDLCAGTGALGIEALSRGAKLAVFVDVERRSMGLVRENLDACGFGDLARIERREATRFLARLDPAAPFDLVLLDPPYGQGLVQRCLEKLSSPGWLSPGGLIFCETEVGLELDDSYGPLRRGRTKRYGDTAVFEYRLVDNLPGVG